MVKDEINGRKSSTKTSDKNPQGTHEKEESYEKETRKKRFICKDA